MCSYHILGLTHVFVAVSGRTFPVEIFYTQEAERDYLKAAIRAAVSSPLPVSKPTQQPLLAFSLSRSFQAHSTLSLFKPTHYPLSHFKLT